MMMAAPAPEWTGSRRRALVENLRARRLPCALCGQPIDYTLPHDDPMAFSYDHRRPKLTHPHLIFDPANGQAAHSKCNKSKGARADRPSIGPTTSGWG